ncbi:hypothetical protein PUN28_013428 [Cardiocondyla obscurior]|uniref:Uncharacterized protein n=1 Tax=Cardiocondyla obscurior TaxID=286306 RepID=A0AAW2F693_9HYME
MTSVVRRFDIIQQRVAPVDSFGNNVSGHAGDFVSRFGDDRKRVGTVHISAQNLSPRARHADVHLGRRLATLRIEGFRVNLSRLHVAPEK